MGESPHIPREVFAGFGFPGAEDLANMFAFNQRYIPERTADLARSRALYPALQTFAQWLAGAGATLVEQLRAEPHLAH